MKIIWHNGERVTESEVLTADDYADSEGEAPPLTPEWQAALDSAIASHREREGDTDPEPF